jgi:hypothetical protein
LNQKKPVVEDGRELLSEALIQQIRRHNVENDQPRQYLGVI